MTTTTFWICTAMIVSIWAATWQILKAITFLEKTLKPLAEKADRENREAEENRRELRRIDQEGWNRILNEKGE